MHKRSGEFGK